jgi:hypothetical protein
MRKLLVLVLLSVLFILPARTQAATCDNTTPGASFVSDGVGGGYYVCPNGATANAVTGAVATATPAATPAAAAPTPAAGGGSAFIPLAPIPGLTQGVTANSVGTVNFLNNLYKFLIGIAAVLAVLEIMWGGFEYATKDSVSKKSDGKKRIQQALFGLALVLLPVLVFGIINPQILNLSISMGPLNVQNTPGAPVPVVQNTPVFVASIPSNLGTGWSTTCPANVSGGQASCMQNATNACAVDQHGVASNQTPAADGSITITCAPPPAAPTTSIAKSACATQASGKTSSGTVVAPRYLTSLQGSNCTTDLNVTSITSKPSFYGLPNCTPVTGGGVCLHG